MAKAKKALKKAKQSGNAVKIAKAKKKLKKAKKAAEGAPRLLPLRAAARPRSSLAPARCQEVVPESPVSTGSVAPSGAA